MTKIIQTICLMLLVLPKNFIFPISFVFPTNLTESYFNEKAIKAAIVFGCSSKREHIHLAKHLMSKIQPMSILNVKRKNFHQSLVNNHPRVGVVLNGDCRRSEEFLIRCGKLKLFDVRHHWLIISSSPSVINKFKQVVLNIDADINVALKDNLNNNWIIIDLYNPASEHGGALTYEKIGFYDESQGYNAKIIEAKYWRRRNLSAVTLDTVMVLVVPFKGTLEDYLHSENNRTIDTLNRFHHKLLRFCSGYYNFTMHTTFTKSWGYLQPNGSFEGMVGALERKLVYFGGSSIFMRADRTRVIDYGRNTWSFKAGFLFRSPQAQSSMEMFLKPFSYPVWLITGVLAIISVVILKMVTTFERNRYNSGVDTSWSLSVVFILGAFCQQGLPSIPKMTCGRITTISLFLLSLMIYQFYAASIVSSLLMKPTNKIKNIKDLVESPFKLGCENIPYTTDLFEHTTDKLVRKLYHTKMYGKGNTSHFWPVEMGINLVKHGGYAFHTEAAKAYPIIETTFSDQAICELREVKLFAVTDLYTAYQKESPFYDMLETCFHRLAENGILDREKSFWHPRKPECLQESQIFTAFHIGLEEFYPILIILLIGIGISLVVLIIEKHVKLVNDKTVQSSQQKKRLVIIPFTE